MFTFGCILQFIFNIMWYQQFQRWSPPPLLCYAFGALFARRYFAVAPGRAPIAVFTAGCGCCLCEISRPFTRRYGNSFCCNVQWIRLLLLPTVRTDHLFRFPPPHNVATSLASTSRFTLRRNCFCLYTQQHCTLLAGFQSISPGCTLCQCNAAGSSRATSVQQPQ